MPDPELRRLPSIDRVLAEPAARRLAARVGRRVAADAVRDVVAGERARLQAGAPLVADEPDEVARLLAERADRLTRPDRRRVLNATGVIVHTNLGRAPLAAEAVAALADGAGGYENLELDLGTGRRGRRAGGVERLLRDLTGAEAALVVNNCAAALLLAVTTLAAGREVVVSRGQLVEIGDGFRVPEILAASGARLVEVGTTNRTHADDYERAVGPDTALLLRAHPSNYRIVGFTRDVAIGELVAVGARHGLPVLDDLGSGLLRPDPALGDEPDVRTSVAAGAALTVFSGDKLLGGPQAGLVVGTTGAVERLRRHPLARALRAGRLPLAALEETLRLHRDPARARAHVPVLRMALEPLADVARRAAALADALGGTTVHLDARVGGGALPDHPIESVGCALPDDPEPLARALRAGDPPLVARITDGRLVLDARTLSEEDVATVIGLVGTARAGGG